MAKHRRAIAGRRAAVEDLAAKRSDVLEAARMEQVALPLVEGGDGNGGEEEEEEGEQQEEQQGAMNVDGEEQEGGGDGAGPSSAARKRRGESVHARPGRA